MFSAAWLLFAHRLFPPPLGIVEPEETIVVYSEWLFIIASTGLLYWLLCYWNTAKAETEKSLLKVNRSLKSFSSCVRAITREDSERLLIQEICRICVEVGGHQMAWVGFADNNDEKTLYRVVHWGEDRCYFDNLRITWENSEYGLGPAGTCIRTGETIVFQNLKTNPRYRPWLETAQQCNFASCVALPLKEAKKTFGTLIIFNSKENAFVKEEVALLEELAGDLSYGITNLRIRDQRQQEMEERLMLAAVTDQTSDGVITFDVEGTIQYLNPSFIKLCGTPENMGVGVKIRDFECSKRNRDFYKAVLNVFATNKEKTGIFRNKRPDGTEFDVDARISPVSDGNGDIVRYVATIRDITHELELQRQLRQAQKIEALAKLSGGIAHDFNNILAVIMTNAEIYLDEHEDKQAADPELEKVVKAALRGKTLIKQFLTFSRQNEIPKQLVSLDAVVKEGLTMLRSTLPTTIEIRSKIRPGLGLIYGDPTQILQVLLNIATNARDAMLGRGGVLEVNLDSFIVQESKLVRYPGLPKSGAYLKLTVTDTGTGMTREELDRIFDPFYTTKGDDQGSGLGLSIAHGIIHNHGGTITVNSIVGVGTSFNIFLPMATGQVAEEARSGEQTSTGESDTTLEPVATKVVRHND